MEELLINKLEAIIRSINNGNKKPVDVASEVSIAFNRLKELNEGMAADLMDKYKKAVAESKNRK